MALTPQAHVHAQATSSGVAFLELLTFTLGSNPPLRVVSNTEDIVSRGDTFMATHFNITMPIDDGETLPALKIQIANVDGQIVDWIRGFVQPPRLKYEIVLSDRPDVVERAIDFLVVKSVNYTAVSIEATLAVENALTSGFGYTYTPITHPGLFA